MKRRKSDETLVRMDDPEQSRRFIETARELGCEENLGRFDDAVKRIGKARRPPQESGKAGKEKKPT